MFIHACLVLCAQPCVSCLQETLKAENGSQSSGATSHDREEQRNALIAAQESCAVQILLESCLPASHADKVG